MATTNETAEESHEESALALDFPSGHDEATWWPVACTIGIIGIYFGAGIYFFTSGENAVADVPTIIGPVLFGVGTLAFVSAAFGWLYQGFLADFWTRSTARKPW